MEHKDTPEMNSEERAAFLIAQAAILNAEVAGMVAENMQRQACGQTMAYAQKDFRGLINRSKCNYSTT